MPFDQSIVDSAISQSLYVGPNLDINVDDLQASFIQIYNSAK